MKLHETPKIVRQVEGKVKGRKTCHGFAFRLGESSKTKERKTGLRNRLVVCANDSIGRVSWSHFDDAMFSIAVNLFQPTVWASNAGWWPKSLFNFPYHQQPASANRLIGAPEILLHIHQLSNRNRKLLWSFFNLDMKFFASPTRPPLHAFGKLDSYGFQPSWVFHSLFHSHTSTRAVKQQFLAYSVVLLYFFNF